MSADNKTLGNFNLSGIPPAPRGVPQIEVTFDIDANGILNVKAKDKATNKEQSITVTSSSGLSKDEIAKMQKDAELHAEEDKKKREAADTKNEADSVVNSTDKLLKESGDKMSADDKKQLEEKLSTLKQVKDGEDIAATKSALEALSAIAQKIGAAMYQQQSAAGAESGTAEEPKAGEPTEGEVVDEEKK
jgi:molecular chaperone DnaK